MTQSTQEAVTYFNLHTTGIGYLNRIREVPVRRGKPFMACDIAALHGAADDVEYTRFDLKVSGADAEQLVREYSDAVQAEQKVLVSFRIGDIWIAPFMYEKGERAGQPGASLKGRLLYIDWIKVDGEMVYKAPSKDDSPPAEQAEPEDPTALLAQAKRTRRAAAKA